MATNLQSPDNRKTTTTADAAQQLLEQIERAFSPQEWTQIQRTVSPAAQH